MNGDGVDDLLIGAPYANANGRGDSGETYLVFGDELASLDAANGIAGSIDLSDLNGTTGYRIKGIAAYDFSGRSVSSAGDVNGDGYDDLLIGAIYADSRAGETYLVFGGDAAHFQGYDTKDGTQDGVLELNLIA